MALTMKQIAQHVQLSLPTVSQVLNQKGNLKPATRERVLRAARELGYRPNAAARAISTGRFQAAALLQSAKAGRHQLSDDLLDGIQDVLQQRDMHLTIARMPDQAQENDGFVPKILRQVLADGLLINHRNPLPAPWIQLIEHFGLPTVWIAAQRPTDAVYHDEHAAAGRATEHLLSLGHRRIAYADYRFGPNPHPELDFHIVQRREGYRQAMRAAGLSPQFLFDSLPGRLTGPEGETQRWVELSRQWLGADLPPTAVVAFQLEVAMPIYIAACSLGLRVPGELSIIGIDSPNAALGVRLGMMWLPDYQIGQAAARMLLQKLDDPRKCQPATALQSQLDPGQTVGPPRV